MTKDGEPAFSSTEGGEIWLPLLEKAWAKVGGTGRREAEVLREMTGAPSETVKVGDANFWTHVK